VTEYRPTFVSHAHADNELCDRYAAALVNRGVDIWYDRNDAQVGDFISSNIQRELEQRSAFVLLMTQHSLDSFWVQLELQAYLGLMAQDRSRKLLPVRIAPCTVQPLLNALMWVDALSMTFEQVIETIVTGLAVRDPTQGASIIPTPPANSQIPSITSLPPTSPTLPPEPHLPAAYEGAIAVHHLTPMSLRTLGFRGYIMDGVECVVPPLCTVAGGVFIMGGDKMRDQTPQTPTLVDGFSIGSHPVTVAEYACAVRAKAVREPPRGHLGVDWQVQIQRLDHPVVCVSWQDAIAYTEWLASTTHQPWRLPTEAEWEKMARWDASAAQARMYPWGDTFEAALCNTQESNINTTTPVGRYLAGASPYGAQDVAGNVWEWTSSLFKPYPYNAHDGRETLQSTENRVQRGGSWYHVARVARTAFRLAYGPTYFSTNVGFRLAVV
jgi:formylglycine-generating enzyme required for sulfatase activity